MCATACIDRMPKPHAMGCGLGTLHVVDCTAGTWSSATGAGSISTCTSKHDAQRTRGPYENVAPAELTQRRLAVHPLTADCTAGTASLAVGATSVNFCGCMWRAAKFRPAARPPARPPAPPARPPDPPARPIRPPTHPPERFLAHAQLTACLAGFYSLSGASQCSST